MSTGGTSIGELSGGITLDDQGFTEGITKAALFIENFRAAMELCGQTAEQAAEQYLGAGQAVDESGKHAAEAESEWEKFLETFKEGAILGAGFSLGEKAAEEFIDMVKEAPKALLELAVHVAEASHELENQALKTHISVNALQEYKLMADLTGGSVGSLEASVFRLGRSISAATPQATAALHALGLNVHELQEMKPEEQFKEVAEALSKVTNEGEQAKEGMALMGRGFREILPILRSGMDETAEAAHRLGAVMSDEDVKASAEVSHAAIELSAAWGGLKNELGAMILRESDAGNSIKGLTELVIGMHQAVKLFSENSDGVTSTLMRWTGIGLLLVPAWTSVRDQLHQLAKSAEDEGAVIAATEERIKKSAFSEALHVPPPVMTPIGEVDPTKLIESFAKEEHLQAEHEKKVLELLETSREHAADISKKWGDATLKAQERTIEESEKLLVSSFDAQQKSATDLEKAMMKELSPLEQQIFAFQQHHDKVVADAEARMQLANAMQASGKMSDMEADSIRDSTQATIDNANATLAANTQAAQAADENAHFWDSVKRYNEEAALALEHHREHMEHLSSIFKDVGDLVSQVFGEKMGAATQVVSKFFDEWGKADGLAEKLNAVANALGGIGSVLEKSTNPNMVKLGGAMSGAATGAKIGTGIMPGYGTAIGAVVGGIAGWIVGGQKVIKMLNDQRDAFFEQHGGWEALAKDLDQYGKSDLVKKIFDAKSVKDFNAAVTEAEGILTLHKDTTEALNDAAQRYNLTVEEMGPAMQKQELDKQAGQLIQDWELLAASGVSVTTLIDKMGGNMSEFVNTSIRAGQAIPEAMRPMLEQMANAGTLLDENGNAFTAAQVDGMNFTQTMTQQFQTLIEKIDEMVSALTGIPKSVNTTVNVHRTTTTDDAVDPRSGHEDNNYDYHAASGLDMVVSRPTSLLVGEGWSRERVKVGSPGQDQQPQVNMDQLLREVQALNRTVKVAMDPWKITKAMISGIQQAQA